MSWLDWVAFLLRSCQQQRLVLDAFRLDPSARTSFAAAVVVPSNRAQATVVVTFY